MSDMVIGNIQRYSIHDGPGIRTTVFFKGCPLKCLWCSNPELIEFEPIVFYKKSLCTGDGACVQACPHMAIEKDEVSGIILINRNDCVLCCACVDACIPQALTVSGEHVSVKDVVDSVMNDEPFYRNSGGGVTLSGGEPLAQPDAACEMLHALSGAMIHTAIETTGYVQWDAIAESLPYLDLIIYDIKHTDCAKHKELTGADNSMIVENLMRIGRTDTKVWLRLPIIPGYNDEMSNYSAIVDIAKEIKGLELIELLPYHPYGSGKYDSIGRKYDLEDVKIPNEITLTNIREFIVANTHVLVV